MKNREAFERMVDILKGEPHASIVVKAEVLSDMGVNATHISEVSGRNIRRRAIVSKGSDGLPMDEIELEFLPKGEDK